MTELLLALAVCFATALFLVLETQPRGAHAKRRRRPDPSANGSGTVAIERTIEVVAEPAETETEALDAIPGEEDEPAPAIAGSDWFVPVADEPDPPSPAPVALDPAAVAIPIGGLADPRAATAAAHPDYEIVELPTGPTILRIGVSHKRPNPDKLIQSEVLVREGAGARLWALTRLAIAIVSFGLAVGLGILLVKPAAALLFDLL